MLKSFSAIAIAALIAGAITFMPGPGQVDAGPLEKPAAAALKSCTDQPWPYRGCVGTQFGNPKIRLITTDRVASQ